jgi:hypothetical protein
MANQYLDALFPQIILFRETRALPHNPDSSGFWRCWDGKLVHQFMKNFRVEEAKGFLTYHK